MSKPSRPRREHLVIVHSFPTNSLLLAGFSQFLAPYFEVHWVDLPGFTKAEPPARVVNLESLAAHFDRRVAALGLRRYVAAGISFGFAVVCRASPDPACRGILALEPFLGRDFLRMSRARRHCLSAFSRTLLGLGLHRGFLQSRWFGAMATRRGGVPPAVIRLIQEQIESETFFRTLLVVLGTRGPLPFRRLPHALLVNPEDDTIDARRVLQRFRAEIRGLLVVATRVPHFPKDLSEEAFSRALPREDIEQVRAFCAALP